MSNNTDKVYKEIINILGGCSEPSGGCPKNKDGATLTCEACHAKEILAIDNLVVKADNQELPKYPLLKLDYLATRKGQQDMIKEGWIKPEPKENK